VAGSGFAIFQSAGAGGGGLAIINGVARLWGAAMAARNPVLAWVKAKL